MSRRKTLVQEIMSDDLITAAPGLTLAEAYDIMTENEVRRLPVVKGSELLGIVTLSDILGQLPGLRAEADAETKLLLSTRKVKDVMTWDPITVEADDTIQEAAERMLEYQVSGLPVVSGHRVIGIITESDIFQLVVESWVGEEAVEE